MIALNGTLTTLHSFNGTDGKYPHFAGLVQATNGYLYGGPVGVGTVFKIALSGTLTTLYGFNETGSGNLPPPPG